MDLKSHQGMLATVLHMLAFAPPRQLTALREVSFSAGEGQILGLIGRNGSGKSTLLKIIAGVYPATMGKVVTQGKTIYLTGMGQGLIPRLSMRENIFLMGSVMGLSQKDIENRFQDIVDLSGLKEFLDVKVYQFSTGMVSRLNFSVMIYSVKHHNPDVLLLDEVFGSAGDVDFQKRGMEKMEELIRGGATVLLASHDLEMIRHYCQTVLVLKKGELVFSGNPEEAINKYLQ